jgi:hypothetical protein
MYLSTAGGLVDSGGRVMVLCQLITYSGVSLPTIATKEALCYYYKREGICLL